GARTPHRTRAPRRPRTARALRRGGMTRLDERGERDRFVERVRSLVGRDGPLFGLFHPQGPIGVARAPGRLDVMGGIADYSGSLVLALPLSAADFAVAAFLAQPL